MQPVGTAGKTETTPLTRRAFLGSKSSHYTETLCNLLQVKSDQNTYRKTVFGMLLHHLCCTSQNRVQEEEPSQELIALVRLLIPDDCSLASDSNAADFAHYLFQLCRHEGVKRYFPVGSHYTNSALTFMGKVGIIAFDPRQRQTGDSQTGDVNSGSGSHCLRGLLSDTQGEMRKWADQVSALLEWFRVDTQFNQHRKPADIILEKTARHFLFTHGVSAPPIVYQGFCDTVKICIQKGGADVTRSLTALQAVLDYGDSDSAIWLLESIKDTNKRKDFLSSATIKGQHFLEYVTESRKCKRFIDACLEMRGDSFLALRLFDAICLENNIVFTD